MHRRDLLSLLTRGALGAAANYVSMRLPLQAASTDSREGAGIHTKPIPSTGETLPVIGLGTYQSFDVGADAADRARLEQVLAAFVAAGGKLIDSSPMYGRSEEVIGDVSSKLGLRPKLFLATKVWTRGNAEGIEQMRASMRKMRAEPMDLIQVHNLVDVDTQLDTLDGWKKEGKVRYVGVTHYTASAHDDLAKLIAKRKVDFVQVNYSAAEREAEKTLLGVARDRGVAVIANRPFAAGGLLKRLWGKPLPAWAGELDCASWAQLLLKFVVSHPAVTCAIPATGNPEHMHDNMRAGFARMPDEDMRGTIAKAIG
jgi:diketogulonate reductase-like aldo/keto reductase